MRDADIRESKATIDLSGDANIVLIGMPGVGKSSAGVVSAKMIGYDFVDVDLLIQNKYGSTLQEMIDSCGVEEFIRREGSVLGALDLRRTVISTGGSAIYSLEAMDRLAANSVVVYLRAGIEELHRRLPAFDDRGVVMRDDSINTLDALYDERAPLYERFAHALIDTDGLSISEVAFAIKAIKDSIDRAR